MELDVKVLACFRPGFFVSYNEALIITNFPKIAFLQNRCPADHPGQQVSRGCLLDTYFGACDYLEVYDV